MSKKLRFMDFSDEVTIGALGASGLGKTTFIFSQTDWSKLSVNERNAVFSLFANNKNGLTKIPAKVVYRKSVEALNVWFTTVTADELESLSIDKVRKAIKVIQKYAKVDEDKELKLYGDMIKYLKSLHPILKLAILSLPETQIFIKNVNIELPPTKDLQLIMTNSKFTELTMIDLKGFNDRNDETMDEDTMYNEVINKLHACVYFTENSSVPEDNYPDDIRKILNNMGNSIPVLILKVNKCEDIPEYISSVSPISSTGYLEVIKEHDRRRREKLESLGQLRKFASKFELSDVEMDILEKAGVIRRDSSSPTGFVLANRMFELETQVIPIFKTDYNAAYTIDNDYNLSIEYIQMATAIFAVLLKCVGTFRDNFNKAGKLLANLDIYSALAKVHFEDLQKYINLDYYGSSASYDMKDEEIFEHFFDYINNEVKLLGPRGGINTDTEDSRNQKAARYILALLYEMFRKVIEEAYFPIIDSEEFTALLEKVLKEEEEDLDINVDFAKESIKAYYRVARYWTREHSSKVAGEFIINRTLFTTDNKNFLEPLGPNTTYPYLQDLWEAYDLDSADYEKAKVLIIVISFLALVRGLSDPSIISSINKTDLSKYID